MRRHNTTEKRTTEKRLLPLALVCALAAPAPGALAQRAGNPEFDPMPNWTLELGGARSDGAEVLYSRAMGAFLVVAPELTAPVLLSARTREVNTVQTLKLAPTRDGGYELLPNAVAGSHGQFEMEGDEARFTLDGRTVVVAQRPWMQGYLTPAEMRAANAKYESGATRYRPDPAALSRLEALDAPIRVDIFLGEWCPRCTDVVPRMVKVDQTLGDGPVTFRYYGLPQGFSGDPVAARVGVRAVPTAIIYRGDEELGRIPSEAWDFPERAILSILEG